MKQILLLLLLLPLCSFSQSILTPIEPGQQILVLDDSLNLKLITVEKRDTLLSFFSYDAKLLNKEIERSYLREKEIQYLYSRDSIRTAQESALQAMMQKQDDRNNVLTNMAASSQAHSQINYDKSTDLFKKSVSEQARANQVFKLALIDEQKRAKNWKRSFWTATTIAGILTAVIIVNKTSP